LPETIVFHRYKRERGFKKLVKKFKYLHIL